MSREPSSVLSQPDKMDRACVDAERDSSGNTPKSTCRSVSEEAKGEVFLKLLLSVSSVGLPREEDYGSLSSAERADVDRRVLRVRNNVAMKALKTQLKRLRRQKSARKHQSCPVEVTELAGSTIHEEEEALVGSRPPSSLPAGLGEGEDEVDGGTTGDPPHGWKGANQKSARLSRETEEVDSMTACTPSGPDTTPPLQTSQTKQSVQRVDSTASSRSTDSGYTSDRGACMANGVVGRAALEDLAENEESTPSSNHSVLILNPGLSQGDLEAERDGSNATILSAKNEDVFATSFEQAMTHQVRVEEHTSTAYDEKGQVVTVTRERSIEETTLVTVSGVSGWVGGVEVKLSEEELSMASNDEEVRYLQELKCRYQAEFSNVMEFQELMKTLRRPPTLSDFLAFKLKHISDRYDADYDVPINNAVSMIVSGSVEKGLSDSFFSSAVEPLLHQAKKAADLPFLMSLLGRRLVEVLPQIDKPFQNYSVRLVKEMMADGVVDLVGRTVAHDFDEVLDTDDIIAVLTNGDPDVHYNPQEVSELIQRHFSSADDLTKLPGVPGVNRTVKTTRKLLPSGSDNVDGPDPSQDTDSDSGTDTPPGDPLPAAPPPGDPLLVGPPPGDPLPAAPPPVTALLDELADDSTKSLGHSVMKTVPFVLMVALQNLM